jgi:fructose-1-phosphate kinase PfkB-like protein
MENVSTVPVSDAMLALAFVGDLSKGQPTNHSVRTARLAALLAAQDGAGAEVPRQSAMRPDVRCRAWRLRRSKWAAM